MIHMNNNLFNSKLICLKYHHLAVGRRKRTGGVSLLQEVAGLHICLLFKLISKDIKQSVQW
jgi:hypothetical protein